jgi:hypothetical protein
MGKLVLASRLITLVVLVLVAIYYAFRQEIRPDLTYYIRLGLHALLIISVAALFVTPIVEFRALQIYGLVASSSSSSQSRVPLVDPMRSLLAVPRVIFLGAGVLLLLVGTAWSLLVNEDKLTHVPGVLSAAGACVCLLGTFGIRSA